ncbi:MAG TPA: DMT family transporter [Vicinamibacteria bacterium]|nr:DMT family transporter [Vicinamibacteria bacterium]
MSSPYLLLGLAVLFVSSGSILIRFAEAPPLAVCFYRVGLAALCLAPVSALPAARAWPRLALPSRTALVASGVALALHFATWVTSLSYTSIASSVLLVNTAPLFAVAFSRAFLGEKAPGHVLAAIGLALAGAALIATGDWSAAPSSLWGSLLAVAGALTLALYHVAGRGLRETMPLYPYVFTVWTVAALTLGILCAAARVPFLGYDLRAVLCFVGLALVPTLAGHGLVNRSLRSLPAPTVGLFLLGEPLGASLLGYLFFGEVPGRSTLVGGALVLAALVLVVARRE